MGRIPRGLVVLPLLFFAGCALSIDLTPRIRPLEEKTVEGRGREKILLLDLSGVYAEEPLLTLEGRPRVPLLARVREELDKAEADSRVKALVLRINSPGGTVTASDTLYREILRVKTTRKIPVVAAIMDIGASGGYYVALAADRIVAHPTAITGSIGVLMLTVDAEGLLQKIGVTPTAIKSGAKKDMGAPFRALSPEERAIFQSVIDQLHARFVSLIVRERALPEARVRELADGRIFTAAEAKAAKLVDAVGYLDEAVAMARQAAGLSEARVVMYHRPKQYRATIYSAAEPAPPNLSAADLARLVIAGPKFLYLWWP